jgi:hypothetical protein
VGYRRRVALPALSLLVSVLVGVAPGSDGALATSARPPPIPLTPGLIEGALPDAPSVVTLKTGYFGQVTLNHTAHLARKLHCRDCHGDAKIGPIEFTPRIAHDRCRGCHVERAKGPTDCRGCHEVPAAPVEGAPTTAEGEATTAVGAAAAGGTTAGPASEVVAAIAALPLPPPDPVVAPQPFIQAAQLALLAGNGTGLSARVVSFQVPVVLSYAVYRVAGGPKDRTLAVVGVGGVWRAPIKYLPLGAELNGMAEGLLGLDAAGPHGAELAATLGARIGAEWIPPWASRVPLVLGVAGVMDLFHGGFLNPVSAFVTLGVGTPPRRLP